MEKKKKKQITPVLYNRPSTAQDRVWFVSELRVIARLYLGEPAGAQMEQKFFDWQNENGSLPNKEEAVQILIDFCKEFVSDAQKD